MIMECAAFPSSSMTDAIFCLPGERSDKGKNGIKRQTREVGMEVKKGELENNKEKKKWEIEVDM